MSRLNSKVVIFIKKSLNDSKGFTKKFQTNVFSCVISEKDYAVLTFNTILYAQYDLYKRKLVRLG